MDWLDWIDIFLMHWISFNCSQPRTLKGKQLNLPRAMCCLFISWLSIEEGGLELFQIHHQASLRIVSCLSPLELCLSLYWRLRASTTKVWITVYCPDNLVNSKFTSQTGFANPYLWKANPERRLRYIAAGVNKSSLTTDQFETSAPPRPRAPWVDTGTSSDFCFCSSGC